MFTFQASIFLFFHLKREKDSKNWKLKKKYFQDPNSNQRLAFPNIYQKSTKYLTVVIPAYNGSIFFFFFTIFWKFKFRITKKEQFRITKTLNQTLEYCNKRRENDFDFDWEIIIVDDSSKDETNNIALNYVKQYSTEKIRLLEIKKNRGKGGAIKRGFFVSRGSLILMIDADGATLFSELEKLVIIIYIIILKKFHNFEFSINSELKMVSKTKYNTIFFQS
jgi:dolichyl-phosphate beta-glucosyltransferase